jgi:hypothetical protein
MTATSVGAIVTILYIIRVERMAGPLDTPMVD